MSKYKPADPGSPDRRYVGKLCEKHPEEGGVRYKTGNRCVVCVALARDLWKLNNRQKVNNAKKRYRKKHSKEIVDRMRIKRRKDRGLPPVDEPPLRPMAWVLKWEADNPGHRLTTEDIAHYIQYKSDVVHSYRRKVNAARMADWRAKQKAKNDLPPPV